MARFQILLDVEIESKRIPKQILLGLQDWLEDQGEVLYKTFSVEELDYPEVDLEKI